MTERVAAHDRRKRAKSIVEKIFDRLGAEEPKSGLRLEALLDDVERELRQFEHTLREHIHGGDPQDLREHAVSGGVYHPLDAYADRILDAVLVDYRYDTGKARQVVKEIICDAVASVRRRVDEKVEGVVP